MSLCQQPSRSIIAQLLQNSYCGEHLHNCYQTTAVPAAWHVVPRPGIPFSHLPLLPELPWTLLWGTLLMRTVASIKNKVCNHILPWLTTETLLWWVHVCAAIIICLCYPTVKACSLPFGPCFALLNKLCICLENCKLQLLSVLSFGQLCILLEYLCLSTELLVAKGMVWAQSWSGLSVQGGWQRCRAEEVQGWKIRWQGYKC